MIFFFSKLLIRNLKSMNFFKLHLEIGLDQSSFYDVINRRGSSSIDDCLLKLNV